MKKSPLAGFWFQFEYGFKLEVAKEEKQAVDLPLGITEMVLFDRTVVVIDTASSIRKVLT